MQAEFIREICLAFPNVKEDIKWGHDLCFMITEKMFCVTGIEGDFGVSLKVKDDEFEELTSKEGIIPAPYLARYKWIHVGRTDCFSKQEWKDYLRQSYELVSSKIRKKKIRTRTIEPGRKTKESRVKTKESRKKNQEPGKITRRKN